MSTYSVLLVGSNLVVTITDGDRENIKIFNLFDSRIQLSKATNALILQNQNDLVSMKISEITSPLIADYDALKAQLTSWQLAASSQPVVGRLSKCTDSFTTAAGATAYAVGDVINASGAASLRSINVGCNSGYLTGLAIEMDNASPLAAPNPLPTLRVRFFDSTHASLLIADNAADEVLFNNNVRRLGHIDLPIMVSETGRLITIDETIRFPFANLTNGLLYYKIINTTGTPTLGISGAGRGVFVRAKIDQNI